MRLVIEDGKIEFGGNIMWVMYCSKFIDSFPSTNYAYSFGKAQKEFHAMIKRAVGKKGLKKQINATNQIIRGITGHGIALVRPPYGAISVTMKNQLEQPMILWNIDTLDWKTKDAKKTIEAVMKDVKDGDIVLFRFNV